MTEPSSPIDPPTRVCSRCGTPSHSDGGFCPHCGASYALRPRTPRRNLIIATIVVAPIVIAAAAAGVALKIINDRDEGSTETRSFSLEEAHLSFDLPSDWEEFDRDKMQEALSDSAEMDELYDRMGLSSEQFEQMLTSNVDLWVAAPHAEAGFLSNVNVIAIDGRLPSRSAIELQYRALGATDIDSHDVRTDLGDGFAMTYTLEVMSNEAHGKAVVLAVDEQIVTFTVSSHDASEAESLADGVVQSIASTQ